MKFSNKKVKACIIAIGFLCALIFGEIGLRGIGLLFYHVQRKNNIADSPGGNAVKILCLGDSMTACGWGFDPLAATFGIIPKLKNNSWPAQLQEMLDNSSSEVKFQVINMAVVAHPFISNYFAERIEAILDEFQPTMLILMMDMNSILGKSAFKEHPNMGGSLKNFCYSFRLFKLFDIVYSSLKTRWLISYRSPFSKPWKNLMGRLRIWSLSDDIRKLKEQMSDPKKKEESESIYDRISMELFCEDNFDLLDEITADFLEFHPDYARALCFRGTYFLRNVGAEAAELYFKEGEKKDPALEWIRHFYMTYAVHHVGIDNVGLSIIRLVNLLSEHNLIPGYKESYSKIVKTALKRNISVIAMQYPRCDVTALKIILSDYEGCENLTFISNAENFEKSLESMTVDQLFKDRYAFIFGHLTEYGNGLIGENVYENILSLLKL